MLFPFQIVIYHIYCVIFATTNHPYPFLVWAHLLRGSLRVAVPSPPPSLEERGNVPLRQNIISQFSCNLSKFSTSQRSHSKYRDIQFSFLNCDTDRVSRRHMRERNETINATKRDGFTKSHILERFSIKYR